MPVFNRAASNPEPQDDHDRPAPRTDPAALKAPSDVPTRPLHAVTRAQARERTGLAVEIEVGEHLVRSDLPVSRGGADSAPAPGHLMRAAVAACLVMTYKACAAEQGIAVSDVEIDITTEQSVTGNRTDYGSSFGWRRLRWHVRLTSTATDQQIASILTRAERQSPMLATIDSLCERVRTFQVRRPR